MFLRLSAVALALAVSATMPLHAQGVKDRSVLDRPFDEGNEPRTGVDDQRCSQLLVPTGRRVRHSVREVR